MSTELAVTGQDKYADMEMVRTLKETVCKGANDSQFRMFVEVCRATGLNPLLKEIWFVPGVGVMAGRDGYLRVANEHPQFDGMETKVERDNNGIPIKATCSVWRKDRAHPITCEAFYNEYKKSSSVWQTYKSAMIAKVAEVLALKRSFSINGVVSEEEIGEQQPQSPATQQRGSKEAAQEVAERKLAELRAAKPETIIEAETEEPTEIEQQLSASISEVNKGKMIEIVKAFGELKKQLVAAQQESVYYSILQLHGAQKSNQFKSIEEAKKCYRDMAKAVRELKATEQIVNA